MSRSFMAQELYQGPRLVAVVLRERGGIMSKYFRKVQYLRLERIFIRWRIQKANGSDQPLLEVGSTSV